MAFFDTYTNLKNDSQFKKLTYAEQQRIVSDLLGKSLNEDAEFAALTPKDKQAVGQSLFTQYVSGHKPALYGFSGQLTDQDRVELEKAYNGSGIVASKPDTNYKIALFLGEKLDQGDPRAQDKAKAWIASNRIINESLLAKVFAGAKDAVEQLVGSDDKSFNDMAFHSTDFSNLSEMLTSKMSRVKQAETKSLANAAGLVTGFAENMSLTSLFGGAGPGSGLFLQNVWKGLEAKTALAQSAATINFFGRTAPRMVSATAQGVVDVARSLPQLIEKGTLQGPKDFWEGVATTFGTGVAFDLFGNLVGDAFKVAVKPLKNVFGKSLEMNTAEQVNALATQVAKATSPDQLSNVFNGMMSGKVPKELIDQLDDVSRQEVLDKMARGFALTRKFNANPRSPEGFKLLGKAMGYDVNYVKEGVELVDQLGEKSLKRNFVEAMSFMQDNLPRSLGNLDDEISGWSAARITRTVRSDLQAKDLPAEQLKSSLFRNIEYGEYNQKQAETLLNGLFDKTNPPVKTIRVVDEPTFLKAWATQKMPTDAILLPDSVTGLTAKESLSTYLTGVVGNLTGPVAYQETSVAALRNAVKRLAPSADIAVDDNGYHLFLDGAKTTFGRFEDLNEQVWKSLYDTGNTDLSELQALVKHNTGFNLVKSKDKLTGQVAFALRGKNGRLVKDFATLDDLFKPENAMLFGTKMSESLKPAVAIGLDGGVYFTDTLVSGSPSEMMSYMKSFKFKDVAVGQDFKRTLADGTTVALKATDNGKYAVEMPELGFSQEFDTFLQSKKAFTKLGNQGDALEVALAKKGLTITPVANANVLLTDTNGKSVIFNNGKELRQYLSTIPDNPDYVDLLKYGQDFDDGTTKVVVDAVNNMKFKPTTEDLTGGSETLVEKINRTKLMTEVDTYIRPTEAYIRKEANRYDVPELAKAVDSVSTSRRILFGVDQKWNTTIDAIWDGSTKQQRKMYSLLMQTPDQTKWEKIAKTYLGDDYKLSPDDVRRVTAGKNWLQYAGKYFNIDLVGFFENRLPHYKPVKGVNGIMELLKDEPSARFAKLFPGADINDRTLQFISRNMRLDDFLNNTNEMDISKVMKMYANKGLQEMYLQEPLERLNTLAKNLPPTVPDPLKFAAERYRSAILSIPDSTTVQQRSLSLKTTMVFSNTMKKVASFFGESAPKFKESLESVAEALPTDDVLGAINRNSMAAVLSFRPFAAYRNSLESFVKGYPIYRDGFFRATENVNEEYVVNLFRRGLLSDRIFEGSENSAASMLEQLKKFGMKPIQNSEIYSRALIAYSADSAFDDALNRLTKGIINTPEQFKDVARVNFLEDAEFQPVWEALKQGQIATAKDISVKRSLDTIMGNFQAENKPRLFTGYFGKLFGTFGVYSATTIDFYRRVVSTGPVADRIATAARLAFAIGTLTNGFRALGIDYSGFGLTDTLSFSGGPIWASLVDATRMTGTSPEAAVSRQSLLRNFSWWIPGKGFNVPRLLVPGANQLSYMNRGLSDALSGKIGWQQELLGAPALQEPFSWKF